MWPKQFNLWNVLIVVGSIVVAGALTLVHGFTMWNLKAAQMNLQHSLIWEIILNEFELGHNTVEETKNICCVKG